MGCESGTTATTKSVEKKEEIAKIELTEEEKALDKNVVAKLLVYKALLAETNQASYTEDELKRIEISQNELKINYFIDREIRKIVQVSQDEISVFYKENKKKLYPKKSLEKVLNDVYNRVYNIKYEKLKVSKYNEIIEKYKLNDLLKEEGIIETKEEPKK